MSFNNRRKPRTYTYRIHLDDSKALRTIRVYDALHDDYLISTLHRSRVPTAKNGRHFGYVFYQSKEQYDYNRDEMIGGAIPGLGDRRYSLEWETFPSDSSLEMKPASKGGTRIKGERFLGTGDPRLSDYVPIDTVVPQTPTEIRAAYRDETDVMDEIETELHWAEQDGFDQLIAEQWEGFQNCSHGHVIETGNKWEPAYCEDCGYNWERDGWEREKDDVTVVGEA